MNLRTRYKLWQCRRVLNRIPSLISAEHFEQCDSLLHEARLLFENLPDNAKKQAPHIENLVRGMQNLLGGEFRRKLEGQLSEQIGIKLVSKKHFPHKVVQRKHVQSHKVVERSRVHKQVKSQVIVRNHAVVALQQKIEFWKKQGYDTAILEKQLKGAMS